MKDWKDKILYAVLRWILFVYDYTPFVLIAIGFIATLVVFTTEGNILLSDLWSFFVELYNDK